jgi:hypothetical protein
MTTIMQFELFLIIKSFYCVESMIFWGRIFTFFDLKNMILRYSNDFVEIMFTLNENI